MSVSTGLTDYEVVRSNRKTASISIERDGRVLVRAPRSLSDEQIQDLVESRRYWIHKSLTQWRTMNASRVKREYVNGEGFLYLGMSYRLLLVSGQKEPLKLKGGRFCLKADGNGAVVGDPEEIFKRFYRKKGREKIPPRVEYYRKRMGISEKTVRVMELGYRWASCSKKGLNFHWKCMMAPAAVLNYIIVHELAHVIYQSHQDAFWNEVEKIMPEYREHHAWLQKHGANMRLA